MIERQQKYHKFVFIEEQPMELRARLKLYNVRRTVQLC